MEVSSVCSANASSIIALSSFMGGFGSTRGRRGLSDEKLFDGLKFKSFHHVMIMGNANAINIISGSDHQK